MSLSSVLLLDSEVYSYVEARACKVTSAHEGLRGVYRHVELESKHLLTADTDAASSRKGKRLIYLPMEMIMYAKLFVGSLL